MGVTKLLAFFTVNYRLVGNRNIFSKTTYGLHLSVACPGGGGGGGGGGAVGARVPPSPWLWHYIIIKLMPHRLFPA